MPPQSSQGPMAAIKPLRCPSHCRVWMDAHTSNCRRRCRPARQRHAPTARVHPLPGGQLAGSFAHGPVPWGREGGRFWHAILAPRQMSKSYGAPHLSRIRSATLELWHLVDQMTRGAWAGADVAEVLCRQPNEGRGEGLPGLASVGALANELQWALARRGGVNSGNGRVKDCIARASCKPLLCLPNGMPPASRGPGQPPAWSNAIPAPRSMFRM